MQQKRTPSRRHLKCYAAGIAQSFAFSAEHFAWLAYQHCQPSISIDLFTLHIKPEIFTIERNIILAQRCQNILLRNITRYNPPIIVLSAVLYGEFGIDQHSKTDKTLHIGRSSFTVILRDDRGKEWQATHIEEPMLTCA